MAVFGNPEEVEAVASSIRKDTAQVVSKEPGGESRSEGKGGLVKSGIASRASEQAGERKRQE